MPERFGFLRRDKGGILGFGILGSAKSSWNEEKLKEQNRICEEIQGWLHSQGISYKSDVGFIEFPRPGISKGEFNKLVEKAEQKFKQMNLTKSGAYYDVFETTIVVDFPEQKKWFEAVYG